jgi:hypothetical protein
VTSHTSRAPSFNWRRALAAFLICLTIGTILLGILWLVGLYGNRYALVTANGLSCALSYWLSDPDGPLKNFIPSNYLGKREGQDA